MPEFKPHEPAPLNDTPEAKGLADDPQLQSVEEIEREALARGLSRDEAQALAWAKVGDKPSSERPGEAQPGGPDNAANENTVSPGADRRHSHPDDISLGG